MRLILVILCVMTFYDFMLHLLRLILGLDRARKLWFWPKFLIGNQRKYELIWTLYWGFAFLLIIIELAI
jgi:hypothetical protein